MTKAPLWLGLGLTGGLAALAVGATAPANASGGDLAVFEITVTNLTRNQVFSPLLVATHGSGAALFQLGEPASGELALLAEEGDNAPLMGALAANEAVADVQSGAGPLAPGASETITVQAAADARLLSLAAMLVNTNDAFVALDGFRLPPTAREARTLAVAFDAGSELNSESCDYVPGPACGAAGAHDPSPAEGFVYVSNGIHGIADLVPEVYDWRNPVAEVVVRRAAPR